MKTVNNIEGEFQVFCADVNEKIMYFLGRCMVAEVSTAEQKKEIKDLARLIDVNTGNLWNHLKKLKEIETLYQ